VFLWRDREAAFAAYTRWAKATTPDEAAIEARLREIDPDDADAPARIAACLPERWRPTVPVELEPSTSDFPRLKEHIARTQSGGDYARPPLYAALTAGTQFFEDRSGNDASLAFARGEGWIAMLYYEGDGP
jgi:hypothetical protein